MEAKKNIFAIVGSASRNSSNLKLVNLFAELTPDEFDLTLFDNLQQLPHFDPVLSIDNTPGVILELRERIKNADGILICTPEYVFSIPSGLKNVIEWCVSTTVFSNKPIGLITASAHGEKGHEELKLIMKTVETKFSEQTTLLIRGIKGKINDAGEIIDAKTKIDFENFIEAYKKLVTRTNQDEEEIQSKNIAE